MGDGLCMGYSPKYSCRHRVFGGEFYRSWMTGLQQKKLQNSLGSSANPHPDAIDSETGFYLQSYCQRVIDVLSRKRSRLTDVLHIRAQGQPVRVGVGQRWQRDARGHAQQQASGQTVSRDTTCRWQAQESYIS